MAKATSKVAVVPVSSGDASAWVRSMHEHFESTGTYRATDLRRVLGDPKTSVEFPTIEDPSRVRRQVLERSAAEAGYFEQGRDRLVEPGIKSGTPADPKKDGERSSDNVGGGGGGGPPPTIDQIIAGLLSRLPTPGSDWPEAERTIWLDLLKGSFKLIYKDTKATK